MKSLQAIKTSCCKRWIANIDVFLFLIFAAAIASAEGQREISGNTELHVVMGASDMGSNWYPVASRISVACMKYTDTVIAVHSSSGGYENIEKMRNRNFHLGFAESHVAGQGYRGEGIFENIPYSEARFVARLYPIVLQAVTGKDSNIKTVYDFKGRRFSPVSQNTAKNIWADIFTAAYSIDSPDIVWKNFANGERDLAFRDKLTDIIGFEDSCPSGSIISISVWMPVKIIPIGGLEQKALLQKYEWFTPWVIPAGTYPGQDKDIETVAVDTIIVADENVSEQAVYDIVSTIFGNGLNIIRSVHEMSSYIDLNYAVSGAGNIPLHPGAEKFYREKSVIK